ncbi:hypothetical protein [Streptomyces halobius]|uniref:Metallothionein n=1 Tax=Streptomyces halobius TaxID=2879846 RepID=A0ABY4MK62_9ACTN|nr:hypothetical protein [Streptomyces halobius]UQA98195.1 hypothetical protein K9S39_19805 [Streptomyces halobius]
MALMADSPTLTPHDGPSVVELPLLNDCNCGPGCGCGCQSGGPCQCGGGCG